MKDPKPVELTYHLLPLKFMNYNEELTNGV